MIIRKVSLPVFSAVLVLLTAACSSGSAGTVSAGTALPPVFANAAPVPGALFGEKPADPEERFQRLEEAVQSLRHDLDSVLPVKLNMPVAETAPPPPAAVPIGDVTGVRIADHADKTRVVLDMTAAPDTTARMEGKGRTLVVPLPNMNWTGKKSWEADSAQLVSGYRMEKGVLRVDLMYASQIKAMDVLPPAGKNKSYRLVIDLFSPDVHK